MFQINENQKAKCRIIVLCNKHNGQFVCWPVFSSMVWWGCWPSLPCQASQWWWPGQAAAWVCVVTPTSHYPLGQHSGPVARSADSSHQGARFNSPPRGGGEFFSAGCRGWVITSNQWERRRGKGEKEKEIEKSLWRHLIGAPGQVTKSLHLIGQPNQTNWLVECSRRSPQERV